ncbi:LysM peptidoglycan-binding domain-containing protein [Candidatus Peregrinibacteria bacterium]|nr:LysM peptidoglycan-binding domain-containing protein [Candidatus Peregrinibacteria bacterium]
MRSLIKITLSITILLFTGFNVTKADNIQPIIEKNNNSNSPLEFGTVAKYDLTNQETIIDNLFIKNSSDQSKQNYQIKILESVNSTTGKITASLENSPKNKSSLLPSLVKFEPNTFTLQPQESKIINVLIKKTDQIPPGNYTGSIVVEKIPNQDEKQKSGVIINTRKIYNIIISIPGKTISEYSIQELKYQKKENNYLFSQKILNSGTNLLEIRGNFSLSNKLNYKIDPFLLSPNSNFQINKKFDYKGIIEPANLTLKLEIFQYNPEEGAFTKLDSVNTSINLWLINWINIIIFLIISVLIIIIIIVFTLLKKKSTINNTSEYTVKSKENIQTIAKTNNISWQKIAKINKLKPPYHLQKGDVILIPKKTENSVKQNKK